MKSEEMWPAILPSSADRSQNCKTSDSELASYVSPFNRKLNHTTLMNLFVNF